MLFPRSQDRVTLGTSSVLQAIQQLCPWPLLSSYNVCHLQASCLMNQAFINIKILNHNLHLQALPPPATGINPPPFSLPTWGCARYTARLQDSCNRRVKHSCRALLDSQASLSLNLKTSALESPQNPHPYQRHAHFTSWKAEAQSLPTCSRPHSALLF